MSQAIPLEVLQKLEKKMEGQATEETKYTQLDRMSEPERLDFFTEYQDFKQVLRMNKIMTFTRLAPLVFGDTKDIREMLDVFNKHAIDHKLHMTSLQRKRELAIVHALKNDDGIVTTRRGIDKFLGTRR